MTTEKKDVTSEEKRELKPFLIKLKRQPSVERHISFDINCENPDFAEMIDTLQTLSDANDDKGYLAAKKAFVEAGGGSYDFRITDTEVFLYKTDPEHKVTLDIAVQVKGPSITWYFYTDNVKDEYSQDFRDELYIAAGKAHEKVDNGCGLYYRGSNAYHVKTMHVEEKEAFYNHNHYRIKDNIPVTPHDFAQHMIEIVKQKNMDQWFIPGEEKLIIAEFEKFYKKWIYKGENGDEPSAAEIYAQRADQKLNKADLVEFHLFGAFQEPCRISTDEIKADYDTARRNIEEALEATDKTDVNTIQKLNEELNKMTDQLDKLVAFRAKGGSRGLGADYAMTRQVENSTLPFIEVLPVKDDQVVQVIDFQEAKWAKQANKEVSRIMDGIIENYLNMTDLSQKEIQEIERLRRLSGKPLPQDIGNTLPQENKEKSEQVAAKGPTPHEIRQSIKEQKGMEPYVNLPAHSMFATGVETEALLEKLAKISDEQTLKRIIFAMPHKKIEELEKVLVAQKESVSTEKESPVKYNLLEKVISDAKESTESKYNIK